MAAGPVRVRRASSGASTATVLAYLVVSLIALLPGAILKLDQAFWGGTLSVGALAVLQRSLVDIRFGSGLRFWLGVSGASMMGLMLLYPLRKFLARDRWLGRIGGWFQLHLVLGFFGPVLILYHCNFGHGGSNANMALWSMLVVVASGIVGHFVYQNASADFYLGKQKARAQLDAIAAVLGRLDAMHPSRRQLIDELEAFEAELLTPRQGVASSLAARWKLERRRHNLARSLSWHLAHCAQQLKLTAADHDKLRGIVGAHLHTYVGIARRASSHSVREQIWARWRLFHLPVFLLMVVAIVLHVVAVWDIDAPADDLATAPPPASEAAPPRTPLVDPTAPTVHASVRSQSGTQAPTQAPTAAERAALSLLASKAQPHTSEAPPADLPRGPRLVSVGQLNDTTGSGPNSPERTPEPAKATATVRLAPRPQPKLDPTKSDATKSDATKSDVAKPDTAKPDAAGEAARSAVRVADSQPRPTPSPPTDQLARLAKSELTADQQELQRRLQEPPPAPQPPASRSQAAPPMGLGGSQSRLPKPRTLAEQIAHFKEMGFAHGEAETGFALTGKHLTVDCAQCHQKPLRDERQDTTRECIACHKKDDSHSGRRPDCARCHTTNRWSQRLRNAR